MAGELRQILMTNNGNDALAKHNTMPFEEQGLKFGEKLRTGRDFVQEGAESLTGPLSFITKRVNKGINKTFENDPCAIYLFNGHTTYDVYAQCQLDAKPTLKQTVEQEAKEYEKILPSLSPQDQIRAFEQLQDRSIMLRKYSYDDYAKMYETVSAKLQPTLISNLHQRSVELDQQLKEQRDMSAEDRAKHAQDLQEIREQLIPIQKFCETQQNRTNNLEEKNQDLHEKIQNIDKKILKKEIELNNKIQLTQKSIEKIEENFAQFNLKYDTDRAKQDQQYRAMWNALGKIVEHQENQQKHQKAMANVQGVSDAFGAVQQLGTLMGDKTLAKVGQLGQIGASVFKNVCLLTGYGGFTAVSGLAALGPIAALAIAGCSLVQLFGPKRPTEMEVLMEQVQALRKEMRQYFKQSFENQQRIYEVVSRTYQALVAELKPLILGDIRDVKNSVQILSDRILGAMIESKQEELKLLFKQVDDHVQQYEQHGPSGLDITTLSEKREKLSEWIRVRLTNGLLTGNNLFESTPQGKIPNDIFSDKAKYHAPSLVVFLARIAQELDPAHYQNIDYRKLSHMPLLAACYSKYQQVIYLEQAAQQYSVAQKIDKHQKKLAKINHNLNSLPQNENSNERKKLTKKEHKLVKKIKKLQEKLFILSPENEVKKQTSITDPTVADMNTTTNNYRMFIDQLESHSDIFSILINKHNAALKQLKQVLTNEKSRRLMLQQENMGFIGTINQLVNSDIPASRDIAHYLQQMRYCQLLITSYCEIAYLDPQIYISQLTITAEQLEQSILDWTNIQIFYPAWKSINNDMHLKAFHADYFKESGESKVLIAVRNTTQFKLLKYDTKNFQITPYAEINVPFSAGDYTSTKKNHAQYGYSVRSIILNVNGKSQFYVLFRDNTYLRISRFDEKKNSLTWCAQGPRWKSKDDNIGCGSLRVVKAIGSDRDIAYQATVVSNTIQLNGYDPIADRWVIQSTHPLRLGTYDYQLASVNGKVYAIYQRGNKLNVLEFDPANNQSPWRSLPEQTLQTPAPQQYQTGQHPVFRNGYIPAPTPLELSVTACQLAGENTLLVTCNGHEGLEVWQLNVDKSLWQNRYLQSYKQETTQTKMGSLRFAQPQGRFIMPPNPTHRNSTNTCLITQQQHCYLAIGTYTQADKKSEYSWHLLNLANGTIELVKQPLSAETYNFAVANGVGSQHLLQLSLKNDKGLSLQQHQIFTDALLEQESAITDKAVAANSVSNQSQEHSGDPIQP